MPMMNFIPCDGTDVFRLSFRPDVGFGHAACRNGRKRTPGRDSPCAKV